jgi:hypothetical protein
MSITVWIFIFLILFILIIFLLIKSANNIIERDAIPDITAMTIISFDGINDSGYNTSPTQIDDGNVPIPTNSSFFFFGTDYGITNTIYLNSNNALIFGTYANTQSTVNLSATSCPAILLGNYDRLLSGVSYKKKTTSTYTIVTILSTFSNYYTDSPILPCKMVIRLIREKSGQLRQWVEVSLITSPTDPGYSNNPSVSYPSGTNGGMPIDTNGNPIDPTKRSPFNITDGNTFFNPCGTMYSTESPASGTSFLFESNSNGTQWRFLNHAHIK